MRKPLLFHSEDDWSLGCLFLKFFTVTLIVFCSWVVIRNKTYKSFGTKVGASIGTDEFTYWKNSQKRSGYFVFSEDLQPPANEEYEPTSEGGPVILIPTSGWRRKIRDFHLGVTQKDLTHKRWMWASSVQGHPVGSRYCYRWNDSKMYCFPVEAIESLKYAIESSGRIPKDIVLDWIMTFSNAVDARKVSAPGPVWFRFWKVKEGRSLDEQPSVLETEGWFSEIFNFEEDKLILHERNEVQRMFPAFGALDEPQTKFYQEVEGAPITSYACFKYKMETTWYCFDRATLRNLKLLVNGEAQWTAVLESLGI